MSLSVQGINAAMQCTTCAAMIHKSMCMYSTSAGRSTGRTGSTESLPGFAPVKLPAAPVGHQMHTVSENSIMMFSPASSQTHTLHTTVLPAACSAPCCLAVACECSHRPQGHKGPPPCRRRVLICDHHVGDADVAAAVRRDDVCPGEGQEQELLAGQVAKKGC